MIELYIIPNIDQPWKRELIGEYASPEHCQAKAKFTKQEMTVGLNGDIIQGKYIIEFAPRWLHNLAIDYILQDCDDLSHGEIADFLGLKTETVDNVFSAAMQKLKKHGKLRELLHKIHEKRRDGNIEITSIVTTKISSY